MKKILSIVITIIVIFSLTNVCAMAVTPPDAQDYVTLRGSVLEIGNNQLRIGDPSDKDPRAGTVVNVGDAVIISGKDGGAVPLKEISKGDEVLAFIAPYMTMSLPPQTNGYAIVTALPKDEEITMHKVASVKASDKGFEVTDTNEGKLFIPTNAQFLPYRTRNIVSGDNITKDSELIVWVKSGSKEPHRVVIIPAATAPAQPESSDSIGLWERFKLMLKVIFSNLK